MKTIAPLNTNKMEFGVLIDLSLVAIGATTASSGNGTQATLTYALQPWTPFLVGDTIIVTGMNPTAYNGTWTVSSATLTSVTFASTATGAQVKAGVISKVHKISNCATNVTYNNSTYTALAGFLDISEIQSNLANATDEIQISLSAIPSEYLAATLNTQIKGGYVAIYRAFFDYTTKEIIAGQIHKRFEGIVSNYSVQENLEVTGQGGDVTHTITIIASSIMGVLENRISGRRTNKQDFSIVYSEISNTADKSMDNVEVLFNSSFDFGRPYTAKAASTTTGSNTTAANTGTISENQTSGERF